MSLPNLPVVEGVEYRHIPEYFGYAAGSDGTILSCHAPKRGLGKRTSPLYLDHWFEKVSRVRRGDKHRKLTLTQNGKKRSLWVHRLILVSFSGPCPPLFECCHNDGNPLNNAITNLRWDTRSANSMDSRKHGTLLSGTKSHNAILTDAQLPEILRLRATGLSYAKLGKIMGVHCNTIVAFLTGRTHRDYPRSSTLILP